jgi:hypothetical protein
MTETEILNWFGQLWPGPQARDSNWFFGFAEAVHFMGLCILFGSLIIVDVRLLGFLKQIPARTVTVFTRWAVIGFVLNAATGWVFFTATPAAYWGNPAFKLKMLLIVLAGLNALAFTYLAHGRLVAVGPNDDTPMVAKATAAMSLTLWLGVLVLGRLLPVFTVSLN